MSHTASDYKTTATYEYNLQVLTYNYTFPEPAYSPYSMNAAVLGIKFINKNIELKDKIQGYQIYYAERDNRNHKPLINLLRFMELLMLYILIKKDLMVIIPLGNLYLKDGTHWRCRSRIYWF